jgi:transposase InsO family protein
MNLYNNGLFCGAQAIQWELRDLGIQPLPSLRSINRILSRHELTHRRTGRYEPKGKKYPALEGSVLNQVHQADFLGPCYLFAPLRFYSLNIVDLASGRCAVQPLLNRSSQPTIDAFWAIWKRLGIPDNLQVDNEMVFYGSPAYPRGMGSLIRLCLHNNIELWFVPPREPWRNGVVEKFNDHYRQKFLGRVQLAGEAHLYEQSLQFEKKHNNRYRYSKLNGKTPMQALEEEKITLRYPKEKIAPRYPLKKPRKGKYHVVRFIRSNGILNIFGEKFKMPPETIYEYVVATINVKEQKLNIYLDKIRIDEIKYKIM